MNTRLRNKKRACYSFANKMYHYCLDLCKHKGWPLEDAEFDPSLSKSEIRRHAQILLYKAIGVDISTKEKREAYFTKMGLIHEG